MRLAIAFALIGAVKIVRGLRKGLTEEERYAVAERAVDQIKKYGDPWGLDTELSNGPAIGHGSPLDWHKPKSE